MTSPRRLSLVLAAVLAMAFGACGGSDEEASSGDSVDQLLRATFSGDRQIESGRLDLDLRLDARGAGADALGGPVVLSLAGPFASEEAGRLPSFALDAELRGGGQSFKAGATSTGDAGYVSFQGTDYAVSPMIFRQFQAGYEEAQKQGGSQGRSFASLGLDPRRWLKDARNAGESKVGDTETIRITGGVDVSALLDDVDTALGKAQQLGLPDADQLPDSLTPAQRRQVQEAVEDVDVEIHTGRDDSILRRMKVRLAVADQDAGSGTLNLDLKLMEVNEDQEIAAPGDPKPFDALTDQLGQLGLGLGGGSGGAGGADLDRYADCIADAGSDADAARECTDLLAP